MSLEKSIADTFASVHPRTAARVLESLHEDELRKLVDEAELPAAAAVVEALTPLVASRCLSPASPVRAAEIVNELALDRAADLLRRLGDEERAEILSHLPPRRLNPLKKLLSFPEHTAGAMMEPRVESFRENVRVDATLRQILRAGNDLRYYLYIVNDDLVLTGVASLRGLVSAPPDQTLGSTMNRPVQALSARAGKSAILGHPAWQRYPVLPVTDEMNRLVGVFRYETFRRLSELPEVEDASPMNVALALGELFWLGAAGMFRGLEEPSNLPPHQTPNARAGGEPRATRETKSGSGGLAPHEQENQDA